MAKPGNMFAGGKFTSLHCFTSSCPHTFQNYVTEVLAFAWKTEWHLGLTGPAPTGQTDSRPPRRWPCLRWHSSQACWGCCQCSPTHCLCHPPQKEAPTLLQFVTSPVKLRKTVVSGGPNLRKNKWNMIQRFWSCSSSKWWRKYEGLWLPNPSALATRWTSPDTARCWHQGWRAVRMDFYTCSTRICSYIFVVFY